jgi:hypothetical protein
LTAETIAAIVCHFSSKKIGWLNKWHFMKHGDLPADVKVLVGGKDGPSDPYDTFFCLHLAVCLLPLETLGLIQLLIFILPC